MSHKVSYTLVVFALLYLCSVLLGNTVNREGFGDASNRIWSNVTDFEQFAIRSVDSAKADNADALLALSLVGSGDVRQMDEFRKIKKQIDSFKGKLSKEIKRSMSQREVAKLIYDRMFETFFNYSGEGSRLKGYRFNQSSLSGIFNQEKYNCISSSLLYAILLTHFDIPVKGVLVPSHAFVQIETVDGDTIEVETTTEDGFDFVHTKENVEDKSRGWYERRGLEYYGWEQYLSRKIVSPFALVMHNYYNQHTAEDQMAFEDRMRIAEIAHLVHPEDERSLLRRVGMYVNESNHLRKGASTAVSDRFYNTIDPFLSEVLEVGKSDSLVTYIYTIKLSKIMESLDSKELHAVEDELCQFLEKLPPEIGKEMIIGQNTIYVVTQLMAGYRNKGEKGKGTALLDRVKSLYPRIAGDLDQFRIMKYSLEFRSLLDYLSMEAYDEVRDGFERYLAILPDSLKGDKRIKNNSLYLVSRLVQAYQRQCDAEGLEKLLEIASIGHSQIKPELQEFYSFVNSFRLRGIIREAKSAEYENAHKQASTFVKSLTSKEAQDRVIIHNMQYLFSQLVLYYDGVDSVSYLLPLLKLTQSRFPTLKEDFWIIYRQGYSQRLFALINSVKSDDFSGVTEEFYELAKTFPKEMRQDTVMRHNCKFLYGRLLYYHAEKSVDSLGKVSEVLTELFPEAKSAFAISQDRAYDKVLMAMVTLLENGDYSELTSKFDQFLESVPEAVLQDSILRNNTVYLVAHIVKRYRDVGANEKVEPFLTKTEKALPVLSVELAPYFGQIYFDKGISHWEKKEWEKAADSYIAAIPYMTQRGAKRALMKNIDGAHYNWAVAVLNAGDREKALTIVQKALTIYPDGESCLSLLKKLEK